jgi:hypothetical protein
MAFEPKYSIEICLAFSGNKYMHDNYMPQKTHYAKVVELQTNMTKSLQIITIHQQPYIGVIVL